MNSSIVSTSGNPLLVELHHWRVGSPPALEDLAIIDSSKTEIETLEKNLGDLVDRMLIGVAFQYGKDSREYEMAGGVRKSERIRRSTVSRLKAGTDESQNTPSRIA